jgi:hypothetical protein
LEPIDRICELENRPRSQLVESPLLFALAAISHTRAVHRG